MREFVNLTEVGEKTALVCLAHHEWKLDISLDSFFANPEAYQRASGELPPAAAGPLGYATYSGHSGGSGRSSGPDRRKIEQLFSKYKGEAASIIFSITCLCIGKQIMIIVCTIFLPKV